MAEDTKLEQAAKAAPQTNQEKKEEPKKVSTLESVVSESVDAAGSLFKLGLAAAIPYSQATAFPHLARDTAILAGAQVAADSTNNLKKGQKYTSGNTLASSILGTAITAPTYYAFNLINKIPLDSALGYLSRTAVWGGAFLPAYLGMYQSLDYLIKNRTFRGIGKHLKDNYWSTLKTLWKYVLPFSLLNVFFVPAYLQIPVSALLSYVFALIGVGKKGEVPEAKKRDKTPYMVAASNAAYKLGRNLFYASLRAIYEIAKPAPKPTAPAPRTTQPATQAA